MGIQIGLDMLSEMEHECKLRNVCIMQYLIIQEDRDTEIESEARVTALVPSGPNLLKHLFISYEYYFLPL